MHTLQASVFFCYAACHLWNSLLFLFMNCTLILASGTVSKWCLCRGVSLHKDQLLQDPLTFKQNSPYELFWFFHYIFRFFFIVLFVHPHHDHPITTVLTHTNTKKFFRLWSVTVELVATLCSWPISDNDKFCTHLKTFLFRRAYCT